MSVDPIPEGFTTVTPYLVVEEAEKAIEFYKKAFGAEEIMRAPMPNGKVGHAEIQIGNSRIMLADDFPEAGFKGVKAFGGSPINMHLYVEDSDAAFAQAVAAGADIYNEVQTQIWGDRSGQVTDPFGVSWTLSTHVEDVPPDVIQAKLEEMFNED